jgi:hypothetical protein
MLKMSLQGLHVQACHTGDTNRQFKNSFQEENRTELQAAERIEFPVHGRQDLRLVTKGT